MDLQSTIIFIVEQSSFLWSQFPKAQSYVFQVVVFWDQLSKMQKHSVYY